MHRQTLATEIHRDGAVTVWIFKPLQEMTVTALRGDRHITSMTAGNIFVSFWEYRSALEPQPTPSTL